MIKKTIILVAAVFMTNTAWAEKADFAGVMKNILTPYLKIQSQLSSDSMESVPTLATEIQKLSKGLNISQIPEGHAKHLGNLPKDLSESSGELQKAKDIKTARVAFKRLSQALIRWNHHQKMDGVEVAYCSMAKGSWLQAKGDIQNPYYGSKMLKCGEWVN